MDPSRYNLNYSMSSSIGIIPEHDMYGNPAAMAALSSRPPSGGLLQSMGGSPAVGFSSRAGVGLLQCQASSSNLNNSGGHQQRGIKRSGSDCYEDHHRGGGGGGGGNGGGMSAQSMQALENQQQSGGSGGNLPDVGEDSYSSIQSKKSPPANGKKTKGRVKIKMEYIDNKLRRYTTFSKRKTGIMKKAYELSTLTGTQVMLLVASETGHVYTFATRKLQPMITSEAGKQLIQTCLNSPDPPGAGGGDQRMSATGFEETELSYNIADEDSKDDDALSSVNESDDSSDFESPNAEQFSGRTAAAKSDNGVTLKETPFSDKITKLVSSNGEQHRLPQPMPPPELSISGDTKENRIITSEANLATGGSSVGYSNSAISNIPHDMLMQLIQSGHLQLHTEEDGSGHQYVAIPLGASATSFLSSGSKEVTKENQCAAFKRPNATIRETNNQATATATVTDTATVTVTAPATAPAPATVNVRQLDDNKPKGGSHHSKAKTEITIKQELE